MLLLEFVIWIKIKQKTTTKFYSINPQKMSSETLQHLNRRGLKALIHLNLLSPIATMPVKLETNTPTRCMQVIYA